MSSWSSDQTRQAASVEVAKNCEDSDMAIRPWIPRGHTDTPRNAWQPCRQFGAADFGDAL